MSLKIKHIESSKDEVYQPPLAKRDIIGRVLSNQILCGSSGSGKSTLMVNLMTRPEFYGNGCFDRVILVSPTACTDDIQKVLSEHGLVEKDDLWDDMKKAPKQIDELLKFQKESILKNGVLGTERVALIYDDCVADKDLLKAPCFTKSFIASRHYLLSTFILSQSFTSIPRRCRLQAQSVFYFPGSNSEQMVLAEELAPPGFTIKRMMKLIAFATGDDYSFLHFNRRVKHAERYRKNLDEYIDLSSIPE